MLYLPPPPQATTVEIHLFFRRHFSPQYMMIFVINNFLLGVYAILCYIKLVMAFLLKSKSAVNKQYSFLLILPQYHICCLNYRISFLFLAHIMFHNKSQAFYCQTAIFYMSYLCNLSWVLL